MSSPESCPKEIQNCKENFWSSRRLRQTFLEFFKNHSHGIMPSASLVPHEDPTLLFTSAGMVPFKDFFLRLKSPPSPSLTSCQKCVRSGGKHNDLDQVGKTRRHQTFFEMLGNFSFGAYFKKEAIQMAWDFLTNVLLIPANRLWITVYHTDQEAIEIWKKVASLPEERILKISTLDNFWSAGDTGPCGPCSEIFYDYGPEYPGELPGQGDEGLRYVEIWNLVFMEFQQDENGARLPLPFPCIDTGMGLERLAAVMQNVGDNFRTDILGALVQSSKDALKSWEKENKTPPLQNPLPEMEAEISHRVLADHVRSLAFLIADGVMPSNEGRGYVLRRILRRALRHVHHLGAARDHLLHLLSTLLQSMGNDYPELQRAESLIKMIFDEEEKRFSQLLQRGLSIIHQWLHEGGNSNNAKIFPGDLAFKLYDTYGFPLDLTQDILQEYQIDVDEELFQQSMHQQQQQSRASWQVDPLEKENLLKGLQKQFGKTLFQDSQWLADAKVLAILDDHWTHQCEISSLCDAPNSKAFLVLDKSPFYGESGGQVADHGWLENLSLGFLGKVIDVSVHHGLLLHHVILEKGSIRLGDSLHAAIDVFRRNQNRCHHSATHLLHSALRHQLGDHVVQKGSLVSPEKLRFDFSHPRALSPEELNDVEKWVNESIRKNVPVEIQHQSYAEALEENAVALFGEKYEDRVRVVSMEQSKDDETGAFSLLSHHDSFDSKPWPSLLSKELCGGSHVNRTGDIGLFKIIGESALAAGIRRIEAVAGAAAIQWIQQQTRYLDTITAQLKTTPEHCQEKIEHLLNSLKAIKKEASSLSIKNLKESLKCHLFLGNSLWIGVFSDSQDFKGLQEECMKILKPQERMIVFQKSCTSETQSSPKTGQNSKARIFVMEKPPLASSKGAKDILEKILQWSKHHEPSLNDTAKGGGHQTKAQGSAYLPLENPDFLQVLLEDLQAAL